MARDPIEITGEREIHAVDVIRRMVFGGRQTEPLLHLGEAQTLYLLQNADEFRSSVWLTDDRAAFDYAKTQGILAMDTVAVMRHAVADGILTAAEAFGLLQAMVAADRALLKMPRSTRDLYL